MSDQTSPTARDKIGNPAAEAISKTIAEIALEKLKNDCEGFYSIDFLMPAIDTPMLKAEAGIKLSDIFTISLWSQYDINNKNFLGGVHIGGEIKL